jgi:hypothetical protein
MRRGGSGRKRDSKDGKDRSFKLTAGGNPRPSQENILQLLWADFVMSSMMEFVQPARFLLGRWTL